MIKIALQQFDRAENTIGLGVARVEFERTANIPFSRTDVEFRQPGGRANSPSIRRGVVGVGLDRLAEPLDRLSGIFVSHSSKPMMIDPAQQALESLDIERLLFGRFLPFGQLALSARTRRVPTDAKRLIYTTGLRSGRRRRLRLHQGRQIGCPRDAARPDARLAASGVDLVRGQVVAL